MTKYDSVLSARLVGEAKEDDRRMPDPPWDHAPVEPPAGSCDIRGPQCTCRETDPAVWCWRHDGIAEWVPVAVADALIRQRNNLAAMAGQFEAAGGRIAELEQGVMEGIHYADSSARQVQHLRDQVISHVESSDREVQYLRNQVHYVEGQRDDHRATLNRFADRLRVVHEDPKIEAAVSSALDERDDLRTGVKRLQAVIEALDVLKRSVNTADSISLHNDRTQSPDQEAERRASLEESRAVRAAISAFDAYCAARRSRNL